MRTRPRALIALALFFVGIAAAIPMQIMLLYNHTPSEILPIAAKLTPLNWMIFLSAPVTAWLIFSASRLAIAAVPLFTALVIHNNAFVAELGTDYPIWWVALSTVAFLFCTSTLLMRGVRELFANPSLRWWRTPVRKNAMVRVIVEAQEFSAPLITHTFDLSEGGAFIPLAQPNRLPAGTTCAVHLELDDPTMMQDIKAKAKVVRATPAQGQYPAGVGIQFVRLKWRDHWRLRQFLGHIQQ